MSITIALIDSIGVLFFLLTVIYAFKNYNHTKIISNYWLLFAMAALAGLCWSGAVALEWWGILPTLMDEGQQVLATVTATAFAMASVVATTSIVKPGTK